MRGRAQYWAAITTWTIDESTLGTAHPNSAASSKDARRTALVQKRGGLQPVRRPEAVRSLLDLRPTTERKRVVRWVVIRNERENPDVEIEVVITDSRPIIIRCLEPLHPLEYVSTRSRHLGLPTPVLRPVPRRWAGMKEGIQPFLEEMQPMIELPLSAPEPDPQSNGYGPGQAKCLSTGNRHDRRQHEVRKGDDDGAR